ncbi:MAG: hypothetical protein N2444_09550 [Methylocystis sp.]|nr:hypothetical protein [Methylocystis sp.]
MRKTIFVACLGVMGAGLLAAASASAGPMSVAIAPGVESSITQAAKRYDPPPGKHCIKWTRRYHSSLGFGHKRCVHWQ